MSESAPAIPAEPFGQTANGYSARLDTLKNDQLRVSIPATYATQPGLQLYTANQLNGTVSGRGGTDRRSAAFTFQPRAIPDAPHHPAFPSTSLRSGEPHSEIIRYRFTVSGGDAGT